LPKQPCPKKIAQVKTESLESVHFAPKQFEPLRAMWIAFFKMSDRRKHACCTRFTSGLVLG
jgi:hypothetical protein